MTQFSDHPLRYQLSNELHARPFPTVGTPGRAVYLVVRKEDHAASRDKSEDLAHLIDLLNRYGAPHPQPGATHYSAQIGKHNLKWESHTEVVTYSVFMDGAGERPFDPADFDVFPQDWLARAPGQRVTSAMIRIGAQPDQARLAEDLVSWFVPESLAVSHVLEEAAIVAGDFRIDPAGHVRFAVFPADGTGESRVGRILQRICEIELYKSLSMLGFSKSGELGPVLGALDDQLTDLMTRMTDEKQQAEETLQALLAISAELEAQSAKSSFRFGATGAYEAIVLQRIEMLRESHFNGRQSWHEFMVRRYDPAMRTVKSTERRLATMAERAMRASELLRTRIEVERSAQNQSQLEAMNRRAELQLRLQETVEGLSVVAISYYAVSLAGYLAYPFGKAVGISKEWVLAGLTLPVVGAVAWFLHRMKKRLSAKP
ncbi:DUF3422 domain-containing protein [Marinovum sp. 2_MG-2023]|uniref:DUF3422 family protein n=1 Tax=unclassified Marinovum TaxID=2647166 RepID=UPI0026E39912|nr:MULTISPECIES: DUF3422 domain-containing protein [unclassified Marinovum]MDO6732482.1 DUF3422 domain-containing protein [Marinovum sp. 2_MG-2023]MDO6780536.1 DUF3422 domain-containing protein [Marinovum sp. 1_MG-2023]